MIEHRPLGSVMRARFQVYLALSQYKVPLIEPKSIQNIAA